MSLNLGYLTIFVVIIVFTIIYTTSNGSISSNQEFFPIVYAQSLPLPLPTLSPDPIEANIDDERSGNLTASLFDHQNAVECRGDINTGSRICLPYTFNIDGNVAGTFNVINETIIPTGEWKFTCSAIKQGGVFFFPPLVLDFALNADGSDKDKIDFSYKLDDPEPGRVSIHVIGEHPVTGVPCEIGITYFIGDIILRTGLIPARDTGLQGVFKNPSYTKDVDGNIISINKTSTSKNFGNIDGFGEISRSRGSEWDFVTVNPANHPPIAKGSWTSSPPTPPDKAFIDGQIKLDGSKSFDPDESEGDDVIKWEWKKLSPSDNYVENTLLNANSEIADFKLPNYIPMEFTSLSTPPRPLPIEFSLVVEDRHQTKSQNNEKVSVNVECPSSLINNANTAYNIFNKLRNFPSGATLLPQTVDNFNYFLSGRGDTVGMPEGVSTKGSQPKPLPVLWLEINPKAPQYKEAQINLGIKILGDIEVLLKTMKSGETKHLPITTYVQTIGEYGEHFPISLFRGLDFQNAVHSAPLEATFDLIVTKRAILPNLVSGTVKLTIKDIYDFNTGEVTPIPKALGGGILDHFDVHAMIKCLGARNFDQTTTYMKTLTDVPVFSFVNKFVNCDSRSSCTYK